MTKHATYNRSVRRAGVCLLALAAAITAPAGAAVMPEGARVWIVHDSNACWDGVAGHSTTCATSDQFGTEGGLPMRTYYHVTNAGAATSFAQAFPDSVHAYLAGPSASFLYVSMRDTYTVHGAAADSFEITARLAAEGGANSVWAANINKFVLVYPSVIVEIGTFSPSTADPFLEQFRVTPFYDGTPSATTATWSYGTSYGPYVSPTFEVSTSYMKTVQVGDVFELEYGVTAHLSNGELDVRDTALVSFDLPEGVWLTSQNGAVFGTPPVPEPAAAWLLVLGLGALWLGQRRGLGAAAGR